MEEKSLKQEEKSLKQSLIDYLQGCQKWLIKGDLEDYARTLGYYGENCGRRMRELSNSPLVEKEYRKGAGGETLVWYRYKEPVKINTQQSLLP